MVILYIQAYLDRGYFWALFQLPPAIRAPDKLRICVFYAMKTSKNALLSDHIAV